MFYSKQAKNVFRSSNFKENAQNRRDSAVYEGLLEQNNIKVVSAAGD